MGHRASVGLGRLYLIEGRQDSAAAFRTALGFPKNSGAKDSTGSADVFSTLELLGLALLTGIVWQICSGLAALARSSRPGLATAARRRRWYFAIAEGASIATGLSGLLFPAAYGSGPAAPLALLMVGASLAAMVLILDLLRRASAELERPS